MLKIKVKNIDQSDVSEMELDPGVFDYPRKDHLVYEAVRNYQANQRQGTHCTKTRKDIRGSGKKLWRQKGTGRARASTAKNPVWRSGGTVFGPQPRDYSYRIPKKARKNAMKSVLSDKLREKKMVILDEIKFDSVKTKNTVKLMNRFQFGKVLIVDSRDNRNLFLSSRNVPEVKVMDFNELNVYDVLKYEHIVFSKDSLKKIMEKLV